MATTYEVRFFDTMMNQEINTVIVTDLSVQQLIDTLEHDGKKSVITVTADQATLYCDLEPGVDQLGKSGIIMICIVILTLLSVAAMLINLV